MLKIDKKTWGVGKFRYLLPPGPRNVAWTRKMVRRIMGARVTPDMVYQIMPWSWLADYFTGLGDFIKAVSPGVADRLICDYAYLMTTEVREATTECSQTFYANKKGDQAHTVRASCTIRDTLKMRRVASPFGWGLKDSDLSAHQVAILGALGLSRMP
jgi:hypothetical protein